jgi:toxin YhaV
MTSPSTDALFEAMQQPPPRRHGWWLLSWPGFQAQFDSLVETVEGLREKDPASYRSHPKAKLLAAIVRIITDDVPRDPGHSDFRQGGTLGTAYTSWFRVKFLRRFRLFFRFDSRRKAIVYAGVNAEGGLRKEGDRNDPYNIFRRMLERGKPPTSFDDLLRESRGLILRTDQEE